MKSRVMLATLCAAALLSIAGTEKAQAITFTGSDVGFWTNLQGVAAGTTSTYTITNSDGLLDQKNTTNVASFSFGTAAQGSSTNLFTFNGTGSGGGTGFTTTAEKAFSIGQFTYRNGETTAASFPSTGTSIDLSIFLTLTRPQNIASTFTYDFSIVLTPNLTGKAVKDGDIVSITHGTTSTTFTDTNGTSYTLALSGFSNDKGQTIINQFSVGENRTASADIYATITTNVARVPEPASFALLGCGLMGLGLIKRRKAA